MDLDATYDRLLADPGVVFLLGGIDTGKTTFGIDLARRATAAGIPTAIVDADIGQSTVGPPCTVGLKFCSTLEQFTPETLRIADVLGFVGSITPRGHVTALVNSTAKLTKKAREAGCRMIVVDSTGLVSGTLGQLLKFYKIEMVEPDHVLAFERGGELDPIVGILQRLTPAELVKVPVTGEAEPRSADERLGRREEGFAAYFRRGSSRWRVKPTVFMPALPPDFDLERLEGLVVGMEDGKGTCVGIGVLEYDREEGILRMISPVTEGVTGLRLGSLRIDTEGHSKGSVTLRDLFGSE